MTTGQVRLRSNVTDRQDATHLVPGEIYVKQFGLQSGRTQRQKAECDYYLPCAYHSAGDGATCGKTAYQIERFGCDRKGCSAFRSLVPSEVLDREWLDEENLIARETVVYCDAIRTPKEIPSQYV